MYVMVAEIICVLCLLIPYTYIAVEIWNGDIMLAWWGIFIYIIAFTAAMTWKFHEGGWKHIRI
jgi:hypothetical protein